MGYKASVFIHVYFQRAIDVLFWWVSTVESSSEDHPGRWQRPKTGYCEAVERIYSATRKQAGKYSMEMLITYVFFIIK